MPESQAFQLPVAPDRRVHGLVELPSASGQRPVVVVCHGFKGFLEWGFFPPLSRLLVERGFAVVRFNFTGTGMLPGDELVTDPRAFRHATVHRDREELEAVLSALGGAIGPGRADPGRIGLLGHSRGGGTALLAAAGGWRDRISALVTWSAVASFDRVPEKEKEGWRRDGEYPVVNARTGQQLALDVSVLEDLESRRREYDLEAAAAARTAPWLIVHGETDETVVPGDARRLADAAHPPHELVLVAGGSHTFGGQHPFVAPTAPLIEAFNLTQAWFRKHLAGTP